ncbi:hypothetical protein, partial [Micromonospora deserti]|uniref:hypothetical protein n=1 Tax=Micromonospora deserti TaxID=2070366 RepID=UPI001F39EA66
STLGRMAGVGAIRMYPTQAAAAKDVAAAVLGARWVSILAARGNELVSGNLDGLWDKVAAKERVSIVLPDFTRTDSPSWLTHHEEEAARYDPGFGGNLLAEQVKSNSEYLRKRTRGRTNVHLVNVDFPTVGRLVITDRIAFITLYSESSHGRDAPCLAASPSSPFYHFAVRLFSMALRADQYSNHVSDGKVCSTQVRGRISRLPEAESLRRGIVDDDL